MHGEDGRDMTSALCKFVFSGVGVVLCSDFRLQAAQALRINKVGTCHTLI